MTIQYELFQIMRNILSKINTGNSILWL